MTVRYGVVGCAGIGGAHRSAAVEADGTELVAVCDLDESVAEEAAAEHDARAFTDTTRMIEEGDVDAVSVCTPSGTHADVVTGCAEAGAAILCEKPLEVTAERLNRLLDAVDRTGVPFGGVYQKRTRPPVRFARDRIRSGALGEPLLGDTVVEWFRSNDYYDRAEWRGTRDLDGGVLMNQAPHNVDQLQWILGDVESVVAHCETRARGIESEDTAALLLKFANGAVGTIRATTAAPAGRTGTEVDGTEGTIAISGDGLDYYGIADPEGSTEFMRRETVEPDVALEEYAFPHGEGHPGVIQDFVRAVADGREPMVPAEEARQAVDIALAAYRSAAEDREVSLDEFR
jgi:UDP-N-acetyl-2-amino-2-deoxyglucuronate dehydrogenase